MSALKQEVAAILMDYTDKIPEQVYMNILNRLGKIPDHKDPRKAAEIQKDLDEANQNVSMLEDERELLIEEVHNEKQLRKEWQTVGRSLAFLCEKIFNKKPTIEGTKIIYDISTMDEVDRNINKVNAFLNNLEEWKKDKNIEVDESFIYNGTNDVDESMSQNLDESNPLPEDMWEDLRDLLDDRRNSLYVSDDEDDEEIEDSNYEDEEEAEKDGEDQQTLSSLHEIDESQIPDMDDETICGFDLSYLIDEIKSVFSGKVHNYYGAILLHEDNCWTTQIESINNFKIHHTKKKQMREMKYQTFRNKKSQWHHYNSNNTRINNVLYNR
jgi:hypothetical protein